MVLDNTSPSIAGFAVGERLGGGVFDLVSTCKSHFKHPPP